MSQRPSQRLTYTEGDEVRYALAARTKRARIAREPNNGAAQLVRAADARHGRDALEVRRVVVDE